MYPDWPYQAAWNPGSPPLTAAGGAIPPVTLEVHVAAAAVGAALGSAPVAKPPSRSTVAAAAVAARPNFGSLMAVPFRPGPGARAPCSAGTSDRTDRRAVSYSDVTKA